MNPTHIESSKQKQVVFLLGAILFVATSAWLFKDADTLAAHSTHPLLQSPMLFRILGLLGIIFFSFAGFLMGKQFISNKGGISLMNDSFVNEVSLPGIPVYWKDITSIKTIQVHRTKLLAVTVQNPEAYIAQQQIGWRRKIMKMNFNTYGTPIWISTNTLKINHEEIERLLTEYWQRSKSA